MLSPTNKGVIKPNINMQWGYYKYMLPYILPGDVEIETQVPRYQQFIVSTHIIQS